MTSETRDEDAVLAALRRTWQHLDPSPDGLVDGMIAAVASADLGREYALLVLVESDASGAVRGDADLLTMQFTDGATNVLVHVTAAERGERRLDGWVDGDAVEVRLEQEDVADVGVADEPERHVTERRAASDGGRFSFDAVRSGIARLRVVLAAPPQPGAATELLTPRFEI